jgi:quinol monooxygenase YgiN
LIVRSFILVFFHLRQKEFIMVKVGLFVKLHAKAGKEAELQTLLEGALALANQEAGTTVWFALKFDASTFGIFDAFAAEEGRQAHLTGSIAAALMAKAPELLSEGPNIETVDILAAKLAG